MNLIKTSFWSGLSVAFRAITTFVTAKIIAVYTGPVGMALIEQFQNFIQIIRVFSGGLIQQGVVKYVAEYRNNDAAKTQILSSAFLICVVSSLILGLLLCTFSGEVTTSMLQSVAYKKIVWALAASILLFSLNNLLLALLNGELEIKKYILCNIVNSVLVLSLTAYLIIRDGIYGGLLALVFNQTIVLFFTLYLVSKCPWFKWRAFTQKVDSDSLLKLLTFSVIAIVGTLVVPLSQIIVRNEVATIFSWQEAGYWQGMMKLSNNYAIIIDATLSIYYLPKLSGLQSLADLKAELMRGYRFILPLAILGTLVVYLLRKPVVTILFSKEFLPMLFLFKYQLIGDIARIGSWLLYYVMVAKKMLKSLLVTELALFLLYPTITKIFIHFFGLAGTSMSYAVSYIGYWMLMLYMINRYLHSEKMSLSHALSN